MESPASPVLSGGRQEWDSNQSFSQPLLSLFVRGKVLFGIAGSQQGIRRAAVSPPVSRGALRKEFPSSHHTNGRSLGPGGVGRPFPTTNSWLVQWGEYAALSSEPLSQLTCISADPGSADQCAHTYTQRGSFYPNTPAAPPSLGEPAAPPGSSAAPLHCWADPSPPRGPGLAHGTGSGLTWWAQSGRQLAHP